MTLSFPHRIESGGVTLTLSTDEVYLEFREDLVPEEVDSIIREHNLQPVKEDRPLLPAPGFNDTFTHRRWLSIPNSESIEGVIGPLLGDDRVHLASPVYHRADLLPLKTGFTVSDFVLVNFKPRATEKQIAALVKKLDVEDVSGELATPGKTLRRVRVTRPKRKHAVEVAEQFAESDLVKEAGPDWIQLHSAIAATIPSDSLYSNQWNLNNTSQSPDGGTVGEDVGAQDGWDLTTGAASVIIAILDTGCDLTHEDLVNKYVPVGDRRDVVAGTNTPGDDLGHGTCCAGIAAAESNDNQGVAGVAWNCRIMPIRMMQGGSIVFESRIVDAVNWARVHGAHVMSMSFKWDGPHANADAAIVAAHGADILLLAASGNDQPTQPANTIRYPANHPLVMAVGASDEFGHRCVWNAFQASQFGPDLDVVAPGVNLWTTDISGSSAGYNNLQDPNVPPYGDAAGNYYSRFGGTSGATPHVAGLAGLLRSSYPSLSSDDVRAIIAETAEKVGGYAYAHDPAHPSGTWNSEMGYGRINIFRALDFADAYVKDHPADIGTVPFTSAPFWNASDIVVRQNDDNIFDYEPALQDKKNYVYVRVSNPGPAAARNVTVSARAVPFVGTEFLFPSDWTTVDATHLEPTPLVTGWPTLGAGATVDAKFLLSKAQVDVLYGWETGGWHPCLLAQVQSDNDYGTPVGTHSWEDNNLAQRNISTVPASSGASVLFPFIAGHKLNDEPYMELAIDRSRVPRHIELILDLWEYGRYFPALELPPRKSERVVTFPEETRLAVSWCRWEGTVVLQGGSSLACDEPVAEQMSLRGAELVMREGKRVIAIREDRARIGLQRHPGEIRQFSLSFRVPEDAKKNTQYQIDVEQRNARQVAVGGATLVVQIVG